ncbi:hypothetical protein CQW23_23835 [Capsicum baccatum]|uniref:Uncharacterized protein n=1 Tax=Capsicum baccatum TaxID=33114 RepID=A0A2G2VT33_CAPBA|nr:hypothetical protein CQW23_23835 [Capsicum baccatum]
MQTANCCKGEVLTSMTQDPGRYGTFFEIGIGSSSDNGSGPRIPENFTLWIPSYTCGQPFPVPPSKFSVDKGRRKTKAVVNDGNESLNAIDIPSPRPKKKPLYPYPRQMIDSPIANKVVSGQPESSPSLNISGRESHSPDSVLLAIGLVVSEY